MFSKILISMRISIFFTQNHKVKRVGQVISCYIFCKKVHLMVGQVIRFKKLVIIWPTISQNRRQIMLLRKIYLILTASERISPHCLYQFTDNLEHFNLPVTLTLENNLDFKIKNGSSYDANFVLESLWGNVIHYRPKIDWHKNGPRKTNQRYYYFICTCAICHVQKCSSSAKLFWSSKVFWKIFFDFR